MSKKSGLRHDYEFRNYLIVGLAAVGLGCTSIEAANLKQYWSFNDGSGTVASNAVASGNAGVLHNYTTPLWVADVPDALAHRLDYSLDFDSAAQNYVNGGALGLSVTGGVDGVTISVWIKPGTIGTDTRLFSQLRNTRI